MLNASGQDDLGHAGLDHGHTGEHGFHARYADAIDGNSSHIFGYPGHESADPGNVQGIRGFNAATESDIIYHV